MVLPLPHLDMVLGNIFINELDPVIKLEVMCWQPVGLTKNDEDNSVSGKELTRSLPVKGQTIQPKWKQDQIE